MRAPPIPASLLLTSAPAAPVSARKQEPRRLLELVAGGRVLLTRDRKLLERREPIAAVFIDDADPRRQLAQVIEHFGIAFNTDRLLSRCCACNGVVCVQRTPEEVAADPSVPAHVRESVQEFWACDRRARAPPPPRGQQRRQRARRSEAPPRDDSALLTMRCTRAPVAHPCAFPRCGKTFWVGPKSRNAVELMQALQLPSVFGHPLQVSVRCDLAPARRCGSGFASTRTRVHPACGDLAWILCCALQTIVNIPIASSSVGLRAAAFLFPLCARAAAPLVVVSALVPLMIAPL